MQTIISAESIEQKILFIRGKKVMLDRDVNLIFHFGISRCGGTRKLPYAFTENMKHSNALKRKP